MDHTDRLEQQREEPREAHRSEPPGQDAADPNPAGQSRGPERPVPIAQASLAAGYEVSDVRLRPVVWFAIGLAIIIVIANVVLFGVLRLWTGRSLPLNPQVPPAQVSLPEVPGPGLDAAPELQLESVLELERQRLSTYGWIDRDAGSVHIPIEQAMQLIVEQGVPAQAGPTPDFGLDPAFRLDSSGGLRPVGRDEESLRGESAPAGDAPGESATGESATEDIVTDEAGAEGDAGTEGEDAGTEEGTDGEGAADGATTEEGVPEENDADD